MQALEIILKGSKLGVEVERRFCISTGGLVGGCIKPDNTVTTNSILRLTELKQFQRPGYQPYNQDVLEIKLEQRRFPYALLTGGKRNDYSPRVATIKQALALEDVRFDKIDLL